MFEAPYCRSHGGLNRIDKIGTRDTHVGIEAGCKAENVECSTQHGARHHKPTCHLVCTARSCSPKSIMLPVGVRVTLAFCARVIGDNVR